MCTSIAIKTQDFYFGRNMDLDYEFGNGIVITPVIIPLNLKSRFLEASLRIDRNGGKFMRIPVLCRGGQ